MVAHVQKTTEGYAIVLSEDALRDLKLVEGSAVEILPSAGPQASASVRHETVSTEEALEIFHRTKGRFRHAYEELAK